MKLLFLLALSVLLTTSAGFAQKKKAKNPSNSPVVTAKADTVKDDTLLHRRAQIASMDLSQTEDSRVKLLHGYTLVLKQGQKVKLESGDAAKMPYFLIGDKPATRQEVEALDAADLTNVSLWKRQKATAAYGEKAKYGVVILNTKKE